MPDTFALQVWQTTHTRLHTEARKLWPILTDREDGLSETVTRAIAKAHLFDGTNLTAWLKTIMRNVRRDQYAKGYRKGCKRPEGGRLVYAGHYDYASHRPCLCDPESILIAKQHALTL